MSPELPSFFRRRKLLFEARRLLLDGSPDAAFDLLRDPVLSLTTEADALRERITGILCREAARLADEGDEQLASRYLDRVATVDPSLARRWRSRALAGSRSSITVDRGAHSRITDALGGALSEMRSSVSLFGPRPAGAFRLVLDDVGEFVVPLGDEFTLGHARAARADLGIVADLEPVHALFRLSESFHGGRVWRVSQAGSAKIHAGLEEVGSEGYALEASTVLKLSAQVHIEIELMDEGSSSLILQLRRGVECEGTTRLLLMGRGAAGEVQLGTSVSGSFRVPRLDTPLILRLGEDHVLRVRSSDVLRFGGEGSIDGLDREELAVHLPPERSVDLLVGSSKEGRPPYGVMVAPLHPEAGARMGQTS